MVENLESNPLYRKYEEEKSLLELYGHVSSLTYEEWLEAKRQNNVKESINYWMSKCASLQQEVDMLNEKLANTSAIKWQTGKPPCYGDYLVTMSNGQVCHDTYTLGNFGNFIWEHEYERQAKVISWCKISDIKPPQQ